jgi:DNA polymerase III subunit delta'
MLFDENEDMFSDDDDAGETDADAPVEGIPAPREQAELIGHAEIEAALLALFNTDRPPQALIFSGQRGIGKATMAFRLARFLLKEEDAQDGFNLFGDAPAAPQSLSVAPADPVFAMVASGGHPDLLVIERVFDEKKERRKAEIGVEEIRRVAPFMRKTPAVPGGWRIAIVDDADLMNRNAQNALLKILEEPPAKALLILVAHRIGALLPTILSRASVQNFMPLPDTDLRNALSRLNGKLTGETADLAVAMAGGSLGQLALYAGSGSGEIVRASFELLAQFPKLDWVRIQAFSETVGRSAGADAQQAFESALVWLAGSMLGAKARGMAEPPLGERFAPVYGQVSLAGWLGICDMLRAHFLRVRTGNLDKRVLVMGAFTIFEDHV